MKSASDAVNGRGGEDSQSAGSIGPITYERLTMDLKTPSKTISAPFSISATPEGFGSRYRRGEAEGHPHHGPSCGEVELFGGGGGDPGE